MIGRSPVTTFQEKEHDPVLDEGSYVHPAAVVIGHVYLGKNILVSPLASVRGDEGAPIVVGDDSNIQDGCVIHGLKVTDEGRSLDANRVDSEKGPASVRIGKRVSMAHQSQVHGPARVGEDVFVGMMSLIFKAEVGDRVVIEPGSLVMGVKIPSGRYVPAGSVIKKQEDADALPAITDTYPLAHLNQEVVQVNVELAQGYAKRDG